MLKENIKQNDEMRIMRNIKPLQVSSLSHLSKSVCQEGVCFISVCGFTIDILQKTLTLTKTSTKLKYNKH